MARNTATAPPKTIDFAPHITAIIEQTRLPVRNESELIKDLNLYGGLHLLEKLKQQRLSPSKLRTEAQSLAGKLEKVRIAAGPIIAASNNRTSANDRSRTLLDALTWAANECALRYGAFPEYPAITEEVPELSFTDYRGPEVVTDALRQIENALPSLERLQVLCEFIDKEVALGKPLHVGDVARQKLVKNLAKAFNKHFKTTKKGSSKSLAPISRNPITQEPGGPFIRFFTACALVLNENIPPETVYRITRQS